MAVQAARVRGAEVAYEFCGMLREPGEPADLISYLCTPAASRLNGHIIRLEQLAALKAEP